MAVALALAVVVQYYAGRPGCWVVVLEHDVARSGDIDGGIDENHTLVKLRSRGQPIKVNLISRGCVLELVGAIGGSAAGLASRMAHRLTHPCDATTLLRLLLLLQRLRLPQHDYYLTLGWSGGKLCIHERQLEER